MSWIRSSIAVGLMLAGGTAVSGAPAAVQNAAVQGAAVFSSTGPEWSPDGRRILFTSDRTGDNDIFVMNADGSGAVNLSHNPALEMHPKWSPDGSLIYFDSDRTGDHELYVMNADGSNVRRLTDSPGRDLVPLPSPDGRWLAFNSQRSGNWDVWCMRLGADGGLVVAGPAGAGAPQATGSAHQGGSRAGQGDGDTVAQNLTLHGATDITRSWSADGTRILFDSDRDTTPGGRRQGYSMRPDGSDVLRLTRSDADDRFLRTGPPGSTLIAFTSTRAGTRGIWLMEPDGSGARLLFDSPGADAFPTWSPDGARVAFESDAGGSAAIWVMNADHSGLRAIGR